MQLSKNKEPARVQAGAFAIDYVHSMRPIAIANVKSKKQISLQLFLMSLGSNGSATVRDANSVLHIKTCFADYLQAHGACRGLAILKIMKWWRQEGLLKG